MIDSPKITVIIPVYNAEPTLRRCLDSILAQTFTDFECLLINDGSKDRSGEICDEYARQDSRVKVFHKENGGVSSARNVGLDNARGEWITFCDSDDTVMPEWIENFSELYIGNALVVQGFFPSIQDKFKSGGKFRSCVLPVGSAFSYLYECSALGYVWNKLFIRSIIIENQVRFCPEVTFREDELFTMQYCEHIAEVAFSSKQGYNYKVPDFVVKYHDSNTFDTYCRQYAAAQNISWSAGDILNGELFKCVTSSLFDLYKDNLVNDASALRRYKSLCGNKLLKLQTLSSLTKIIYLLPTDLCHRILLLKGSM